MKKFLCLLLCLCLLAGVSVLGADKPQSYVALGDSIADGYRLTGYTTSGSAPKESFPVLVANALEAKLTPLAVSGMDTNGLIKALETDAYRNAVKNADMISLTIGSNDILIPAASLMLGAFDLSGEDLKDPAALQSKLGGETPTMAQMLDYLGKANAALSSKESLKMFDGQIKQYQKNWESILSTLRTLNPGATIYVTNYYNPYQQLDFKFGTVEVNIGSLTQGYLDQMNAYLAASPSAAQYTVVDIADVSTNVVFDMQNMAATDIDPHPNAAGHALIAKRLLAAVETGGENSLRNFVNTVAYSDGMYSDLPAAQWARDAIRSATELGLMKGADGSFDPAGNLTLAQVLTMAARVHSTYAGDGYVFDQSIGEHWYDVYVMYCVLHKLIGADEIADYNAAATRAQMAGIFARSVDAAALPAKNAVTALPDVAEGDAYGAEIYLLYRAGVLSGNDAAGTFTPDTPITRQQAAAIVSRLVKAELRVSLTLGG